jgi:hypothetical protein
VTKGDLLEFVDGKLKKINSQTDTAKYIAAEDGDYTSGSITKIDVIDVFGAIAEVAFTPLVDGTACNSNASTTTVKVALTDATNDDLNGGLVYIPELDETRVITDSAYSSNVVTITVGEAFSVAPTTTHTCKVIPFNVGAKPKYHASTMYNTLSTVQADRTGGTCTVYNVDMKKEVAEVIFD